MSVFLDVKNKKIVVTNGNVLVAYDIEIIDGELKKEAIIDPKIFNQNNWLSVPKQDLELVEFHVTEEKIEVMLGEDFVDEDNGEVVPVERNEIIVDKNKIIDRDILGEIIRVQAKSVFIHKFQ